MPRITLGQRLEALATHPHLDDRSRSFAADLLKSYNRSKSLTAGRRVWVDRLEQRAAANAVAPKVEVPADVQALHDKVKAVMPDSWSAGFMDSIVRQLSQGRALSERQTKHLESIREEHASDWPAEYADKYLANARTIAAYYKAAGLPYWGHMVKSILTQDDYVPSRHSFMKMYNNNYAQKVLYASEAPAAFAEGDTVQVRSNATTRRGYKAVLGTTGFVLEATGTVTSAVKGGRSIVVLFPGEATPRHIEERHLKKAR
jgi:hypothetical protein